MPRGRKLCENPDCKAINGPRAYSCIKCNHPFTIKGVVASPEKIAEVKQRKLIAAGIITESEPEEEILHILDYFNEDEPTPREKHINGDKVECYMSKDNKFRLRYTEEYMGIPLVKLHDRRYTLLKRNSDRDSQVEWDLVNRFKSLQKLLHYFRAVQDGSRQVVLYRPGDDVRKSRALTRFHKKQKKLKKVKA